MCDDALRLRGDYLLGLVHENCAALQRNARSQPVKVMRAILRMMRQYEACDRREDVFIPQLGCTTGEFAVLHLLRPYDQASSSTSSGS